MGEHSSDHSKCVLDDPIRFMMPVSLSSKRGKLYKTLCNVFCLEMWPSMEASALFQDAVDSCFHHGVYQKIRFNMKQSFISPGCP